ncbi:MAG: hypothetical protein ABWX67_13195 [Allosphingosinicella sp.]
MRRALLVLTLVATGCTYRWRSEADCVAVNVPSAVRALPAIRALADPPPATLESGFVLCSTHEGRLAAAIEALGAEGYSSYLGAAEVGKCLRVARTHEASAEAMAREVGAMCRIAAASRIAYGHWQTEVGGRSVVLSGDRLIIDGERRRLD